MTIRSRRAVRLGIPALLVAVLAVVALWRVAPTEPSRAVAGTGGTVPPYPSETPLTRVADALVTNSVGRRASLDRIAIREVTSRNTFWAGAIDEEPVFVVLEPDARRARSVEIQEGSEVTLTGVVRPAPEEQEAIARWRINAVTARALRQTGTYLEATDVR